jgi:hypothetical protein
MIDVNLSGTVGRSTANRGFCVLRIEMEEIQRREIAEQGIRLRSGIPNDK